jgi:enterochelin esterase-like enzyme
MAALADTISGQPWSEDLGDWSWPSLREAAAEILLPPSWVPALPPRPEPALPAVAAPVFGGPQRASARRPAMWTLVSVLAAMCVALIRPAEVQRTHPPIAAAVAHAVGAAPAVLALPKLVPLVKDSAGGSILKATYDSHALRGEGSFLVYLPPGYTATVRYPVIYLLHGMKETDSSFLQLGLQGTLDDEITRHEAPAMIAVMVQGGSGPNRWLGRWEAFVLEVQEVVNRLLPTMIGREDQAVVGYSMGGYGAMHMALDDPTRFGVVESWEGYFNGLGDLVAKDRSTIATLGLHAFLYGGEQDHIADPAEDAPFAAALRADGADAHSAVYPGEHDFATLQAHIAGMLAYAGQSFTQR